MKTSQSKQILFGCKALFGIIAKSASCSIKSKTCWSPKPFSNSRSTNDVRLGSSPPRRHHLLQRLTSVRDDGLLSELFSGTQENSILFSPSMCNLCVTLMKPLLSALTSWHLGSLWHIPRLDGSFWKEWVKCKAGNLSSLVMCFCNLEASLILGCKLNFSDCSALKIIQFYRHSEVRLLGSSGHTPVSWSLLLLL